LGDGANKEFFKRFFAPAGAGFTEHAVIGNFIVQPVAQEPEIIEALGNNVHQLAFAGDIVPEQKKHHLQKNDWID